MSPVVWLLLVVAVAAAVAYGLGYLHGWTKGNGRLYNEIEAVFRSEDSFMKRGGRDGE